MHPYFGHNQITGNAYSYFSNVPYSIYGFPSNMNNIFSFLENQFAFHKQIPQTIQQKDIKYDTVLKQGPKSFSEEQNENQEQKIDNITLNLKDKKIDLEKIIQTPYKKQSKYKNAEVNIVYHLFSYLSRKQQIVIDLKNIFHMNQGQINFFNFYVKNLRKRLKKYFNRKQLAILLNYIDKQAYMKASEQSNYDTIIEQTHMVNIILKLSINFLKNKSILMLLNSKKIRRDTILEHFSKRRQIMNQIMNQIKRIPVNKQTKCK